MVSPLRVGILDDMSATPPGKTDIKAWLQLAVNELIEKGRLDRKVEFVHAWGLGLPEGTAAAVEKAYRELVNEDVLLIVGPAIGDNALVATPLTERFRIPTINWAGSERARSDYMFHLQVGSHEDESIVIARHLLENGTKRVALVYDKSPIGRRYHHFFQAEAEILGLEIVSSAGVSPLVEDAFEEVKRLTSHQPNGMVYLGLGHAATAVATALTVTDWDGLRIMNTAGIRGHYPEYAKAVNGWRYLDMYADNNRTLARLRHTLNKPDLKPLAAAKGYDLGRLVAEGLARADELTRDGVKRGLELIKWLPAAEGHEGTLLGFGNCDRGALHGRYLVVRQWQDLQSVQVDL